MQVAAAAADQIRWAVSWAVAMCARELQTEQAPAAQVSNCQL